ncbi:LysR family transcriptional regulator [Caulobacter sp. RHG1]|uniref:LysR family transcriptional regulator n=1 Tax=Caulobacter sp. (strain RHG1) TaxID=2545762 RepID=UPI00155780D0|nr:LysR family transcriptional regulator [Caulobacter sp. RHG1]NQE61524.1 Transcriptional regulator, LysR family [Caulobacter sp. RHG1]
MALTLTQLRYFCVVAETGHFGRAARRLHMSQPPLSRQIALMEADLGVALFDRGSKGVTLTVAGRQLKIDAEEILRLAGLAPKNARAVGAGGAGRLEIGFTMCAAYNVVPGLARHYRAAFPQVALRLRELMPSALDEALHQGEIDIAISFPAEAMVDVSSKLLLREPMVLAVPLDHRLAGARSVRLENLADETFIIAPRDTARTLHDAVLERCREAGFTPKLGFEVYLQQTIVAFVAEGLGIALVPQSMRKAQVQGAAFVTLATPPMIDLVATWRSSNPNPCVPPFLSVCDTSGGGEG